MKKTVFLIIFTVLLFFWPVFLQNRIPVNGDFLVSFFSPWRFEDWAKIPAKPISLDQLRLYYPYLRFTLDSWRQFKIPLWNPYNFSGNPHMAELQSGVFYPLFLFSFLPQEIFWTLMVISSFIFSALFSYLYFRSLKLTKVAAYFGALTFSFSLVNICWSQEVVTAPHTALWLPLILFAIDKYVKTEKWQYWLLIVVGAIGAFLSGYLQVVLYLLAFCFLYSLLYIRKGIFKVILVNFALFLSVLLTAFQNFPGFELYDLSARKFIDVYQMLASYLLPVRSLITLFITDFFGHPVTANHYGYTIGSYYERAFALGVIPIIFLLFSFFDKKRDKKVYFFFFIGSLFLSLALDLPISRLIFKYKIPLLSTSIANRTFFFSSFAYAALAAIGINYWLKKGEKKPFRKIFLIFSLIFLSIISFVFYSRSKGLIYDFFSDWTRVALRNAILPATLSVLTFLSLYLSIKKNIWRRKFFSSENSLDLNQRTITRIEREKTETADLSPRRTSLIFVIFLSLIQSYYSFRKYTPFTEKRYLYPPSTVIEFLQKNSGINRFWGYGEAFLDNNLATQFKIYSPEGYDSLNERYYNNLLWTTNTGGQLITQTSRSDAGIRRAPDGGNFQEDKRRLKMLSLTAVKYIIDVEEPKFDNISFYEKDRFKNEDFTLAWQEGNWRIFEYKNALPRAFLTFDYKIEKEPQKAVDLIYDQKTDLRKTLILEEEIPDDFQLKEDPNALAEVLNYEANEVKIKTSSSQDQLFFISDKFYPGWRIKIDGVEEKIYRADLAFRAVPLKQGQHVVEFYYWPESFEKGIITSLISVIVCLATIIFLKKKRESHEN